MKKDNRNYPTTIKWTHQELIQIQLRANALGINRTEYIRLRGLEPIEGFQAAQEQKDVERKELIHSYAILKELNHQGVSLTQLIRAIGLAELDSKTVECFLESIAQIKSINQEILRSIADIKAKL